jgi:hypothetical protein
VVFLSLLRHPIRYYKYKDIRTASDLSTIQFRLIFKGHKSLEYCCLVIHLTSVNTISYAESNDGIFILIAPLGITISYFTRITITRPRDCCCINFILIWHQYASHKVVYIKTTLCSLSYNLLPWNCLWLIYIKIQLFQYIMIVHATASLALHGNSKIQISDFQSRAPRKMH